MTVKPEKNNKAGKKEQVRNMFDSIAWKYDFLNHFLTVGIDKIWRKKVRRIIETKQPKRILDIATGTADLAIEAVKSGPEKIIGVDISEKMLEIGREKVKKAHLSEIIELEQGDSEKLKFQDHSFDTIIAGFGVRNFENLDLGLKEMHRVLAPDGQLVILEFSKPSQFPIKQFYNCYFNFVLPLIGKFFSKSNSAYTYLPESVEAFPDGENFLNHLKGIGYKNTRQKKLTFGIASIYTAEK